MEAGTPQAREASIVLLGTFDPLQLVPQWFLKHELLPSEDAENLSIEIIYKDLTRFALPNIIVEITPDRMLLRSDNASLDFRIHDLAVGLLSVLKSAEISALGLNLSEDHKFDDLEVWNGIGHLLAPKDFWLEMYPEAPTAGLAHLQVQLGKSNAERGVYNFTVAWLEQPGWTRFQINNHYSAEQKDYVLTGKDRVKRVRLNSKFDPVDIILSGWPATHALHAHTVHSLINKVKGDLDRGRT